jgi:arginyl-tRNA synthetase
LYQLVKITKEGALVRMSKRTGNIVSLQDIIDTVSPDVARFFYLYKKAESQLEFDLELALKKSEENPVYYVQYAYVRALNVLKKASEFLEFKDITADDITSINFEERMLLRKIIALKYLFADITQNYHTHLLAQATLDLAAEFHHFYEKCHILDPENKTQSRHRLVLLVVLCETYTLLFNLLGISRPEKM